MRKRRSGPRRSAPSSEHGASTSTRSARRPGGASGPWIATSTRARAARVRRRASRAWSGSQAWTRPPPAHRGGELEGLPPGAGAEVEDRLAGERPHGLAEQLAPLVLDLEEPLAEGGEGEQVGARREDLQAVGSHAGGAGDEALRGEANGQRLPAGPRPVHPQEDRSGQAQRVGEERRLGSRLLHQDRREPVRERIPGREVLRRGPGRSQRAGWQAERRSASSRPPRSRSREARSRSGGASSPAWKRRRRRQSPTPKMASAAA